MIDLERLKGDLEEISDRHTKAAAEADTLTDPDTSAIDEQIASASEINERAAQWKRRAGLVADLAAMQTKADDLSQEIKSCDAEKQEAIESAQMPDGMSFTDEGVLLYDVPFEQASQAERITASIRMGIAMNPKLRVLLIKNGNDLDSEHVGIVRRLAEENGAQVWMERVVADQPSAIVIKDGMVAAEREAVAV